VDEEDEEDEEDEWAEDEDDDEDDEWTEQQNTDFWENISEDEEDDDDEDEEDDEVEVDGHDTWTETVLVGGLDPEEMELLWGEAGEQEEQELLERTNRKPVRKRRHAEVARYEKFVKENSARLLAEPNKPPAVKDAETGAFVVVAWPKNGLHYGTMKKYVRQRYMSSTGSAHHRHIGIERVRQIIWDVAVFALETCQFDSDAKKKKFMSIYVRRKKCNGALTKNDTFLLTELAKKADQDFQAPRLKKASLKPWDIRKMYQKLMLEVVFTMLACQLCAMIAVYSLTGARPARYLEGESKAAALREKDRRTGFRDRICGGATFKDLMMTIKYDNLGRQHCSFELSYVVEKLTEGSMKTGEVALTPGVHTHCIETEHTAHLARYLFRIGAFEMQKQAADRGCSSEEQYDAVFGSSEEQSDPNTLFRPDWLDRQLFPRISVNDGSIDWTREHTPGSFNDLFQWSMRGMYSQCTFQVY